jgi:ubiquinone/menaquinone biosynthesis C-methylase UbiE
MVLYPEVRWRRSAMKVVTAISELEAAKREWCERLAEFMVRLVDWKCVSVLLEAGCGRGWLTLPLATRLDGTCKIIAYDLSEGPYKGDLEILRKKVMTERLENVIETVKGDVMNLQAIPDESVDLIISHELFCELNRAGLEKALKEFYRVLKRGRQMVHAELSSLAENRAQELLIEANIHHSLDTMLSEGALWFSPTVDDVAVLMHKTGFRNIQAHFFETNIGLVYDVAVEQLKQWNIDKRFLEEYKEDLQGYGVEFPLEHVVVCEKL